MKTNMMYAVFLIMFASIGGILSGANLQNIFVRKDNSGANWTGLVVGLITVVLAGSMTLLHPC